MLNYLGFPLMESKYKSTRSSRSLIVRWCRTIMQSLEAETSPCTQVMERHAMIAARALKIPAPCELATTSAHSETPLLWCAAVQLTVQAAR